MNYGLTLQQLVIENTGFNGVAQSVGMGSAPPLVVVSTFYPLTMISNRPLSPHLQIYKLPLTGLISISHRMTGVLLSVGLLLFVGLLFMIARGAESYAMLQHWMQYWPVKLLYCGFLYALFFHLCHGLRHLIWDIGNSFDKATLLRYALYELLASCVLTLITLLLL